MHPIRIKIMEVLTHYPQATHKHLSEAAGNISNSVVTHHITVLIKKGLIRKCSNAGERNYHEVLSFCNPPMEPIYYSDNSTKLTPTKQG